MTTKKMVNGKEFAKKKDLLILFGSLVIIGFIVLVLAAIEAPRLDSPITNYNYSQALNFSCFSTMENATNATLWLTNATGGVYTLNNISTVQNNTPTNQTNFSEAAVDITMLTDGLYNFSCMLINVTDGTGETGLIYSANTTNVTIDNTPPAAAFSGTITTSEVYLNGTIVLNASVNDSTIGLGSVRFNISYNNATGTSVSLTNASVSESGTYFSASINTSALADGRYNITIVANDTDLYKANASGTYEYANMNNTERIRVTIDNTAPTVTHTCTPNVTIGLVVTCSCSGTDAIGINYTSDGDSVASGNSSIVKQISTTSIGTFSRTCTVKDLAGNIGTTVASYEVSNAPTGAPSGGNGGGPSGGTTISSAGTITPTSPKTISSFAAGSGVAEIQIEVSETANNVKVTVEDYESTTPSAVSSSVSGAYKYMNINTQNLIGKLTKATMKIEVAKSWVDNQGIAKEDVALFKYDSATDQWNELSTTYANEDDNYYYYTVELNSFSYFAIASKGAAIISGEEGEIPTGGEEGISSWIWIIIGIIVVAIIIGGGVALKKRR